MWVEQFLKEKKHFIKPISIAAAIIIFDFVFVLGGQVRFLAKSMPQAGKLKKDIVVARAAISSKDSLTERYAKLNSELPDFEKMFVTEEEIPLLLSEVSRIAKDSNIVIMQVRPSGQQMNRAVEGGKAGMFSRLLINLDLKCAYHRLGEFINKLETSIRYLKVLAFDISSVREAPFIYPVKMTIEALVKNNDE